jgi:SAM-dependent methyltransferase
MGFVDYDGAAGVYDRGRGLTAASMHGWRAAVAARVPIGPLRLVVDVGAGTGLFLPMWVSLGASQVVAVEPSDAMRAKAVVAASAAGPGVAVVSASGLALPVAAGSIDVVWLSAVLHHLGDIDQAAAELRRALRPGGRVLIRGFLPGTSRVPWLDHLPGADRARARFPSAARVTEVLGRAGLTVVDLVDVPEEQRHTGREVADWIGTMRHADSILTALDDDEVDAGMASLRRLGEAVLEPVSLSLLTAEAA